MILSLIVYRYAYYFIVYCLSLWYITAIPSRLSNLSASFDIENASIVVVTIEWTSSEEPYGISEFQIVISRIDISILVADDTVKILDNDTVRN